MIDPRKIRKDFPIFENHPSLTYLDSAATSLKPHSVIRKITEYYTQYSANIHRGIYALSEQASKEYDETRTVVARFINADRPEEIIFTRNATESLNLVASTLGQEIVHEGDEVVVTIMEHHANFVPWQQLAFAVSADFKVIGINDHYELSIVEKSDRRGENAKFSINLDGIVTKKTKILAVSMVSNALGTIHPVKEIIKAAKKINPDIITIVDAAQAVAHLPINVKDLGCDFLAFSSHKMLGPTGVGVLWGRFDLLEKMSPYQFGGDMIRRVRLDETTFNDVPHKFEAGTPHISGVIALKEAINYLIHIGFENIRNHEKKLTMYALRRLSEAFADEIILFAPRHIEYMTGVITFTLKDIHSHDIAQILDEDEIAVRAGHHCTMPLHTALGVPATTRASFYIYNDEQDVETLIEGLEKVRKVFVRR